MENAPEAPAEAPKAPESEATPTNSNSEPAQAPDMHGFTSEQLADMQKFFEANGGFDKVKAKISNPTPAPAEEQKPVEPARSAQPVQPAQQEGPYTPPAGAMTLQDIAIKNYFERLAEKQEYSGISKEITDGTILKEMDNLGIRAINRDGSINPKELFGYLDLRAKTVPAKQTSSMPEASAAPTVDYIPVGETIESMDQAQKILMQDTQLRRQGKAGHPSVKMAEDYMREVLSGKKK